MEHKQVIHALSHLRPGAEWNLSNGVLTWHDKTQSRPSEAELENACHGCNPSQEGWKKLSTLEEKVNFLAKTIGLE